jgi:hypothetical protein
MKVRVYLRIAPTSRGFRVAATSKPSTEPLRSTSYGHAEALPTVAFGVLFDLPREAFDVPVVAEIAVDPNSLRLLPTEARPRSRASPPGRCSRLDGWACCEPAVDHRRP